VNNVIDGVVITLEDITALKEAHAALSALNAKLEQRERNSALTPEIADLRKPE
jgi:citrate lyase beta subunit